MSCYPVYVVYDLSTKYDFSSREWLPLVEAVIYDLRDAVAYANKVHMEEGRDVRVDMYLFPRYNDSETIYQNRRYQKAPYLIEANESRRKRKCGMVAVIQRRENGSTIVRYLAADMREAMQFASDNYRERFLYAQVHGDGGRIEI